MADGVRELVRAILEESKTMVLSTCHNNIPWASTLFFVSDNNFNIYFISRTTRRHSYEIEHNPNVAVAMAPPHKDFGLARGLQIEGRAKILELSQADISYRLFQKKFPNLAANIKLDQLKDSKFIHKIYKITPKRFQLIYEEKFGVGEIIEARI